MVASTNQIKKRAVRYAKNMKMNTTQTNIGRQVLDPVVRVLDLVIVEIVSVTKKIGQVFRLLDRASLVRYCQHLKIGQVYSISGFVGAILSASFDCLVPRGSSDTATIFLGAAKRQHLGRLYLGK
ncbi:hypothetical protein QYE76_016905 [Lolium multiflorum]|uniref:Uncharacterized protein n=1 Tax=Lolium multiflorum TaxID=4521 RepID=A0AAD8QFD6_LOLMU|nr:hypothetical protein QYE76_016905 [Lolium multiflorum]